MIRGACDIGMTIRHLPCRFSHLLWQICNTLRSQERLQRGRLDEAHRGSSAPPAGLPPAMAAHE